MTALLIASLCSFGLFCICVWQAARIATEDRIDRQLTIRTH
jgi:hypothetical protein